MAALSSCERLKQNTNILQTHSAAGRNENKRAINKIKTNKQESGFG
jgi:hypothetical protein